MEESTPWNGHGHRELILFDAIVCQSFKANVGSVNRHGAPSLNQAVLVIPLLDGFFVNAPVGLPTALRLCYNLAGSCPR